MLLNKTLRLIALAGIFLLPLIPIYVARSMFFPFITGKNFAFRIIVEIVFAAWLLLCVRDRAYRPRRSTILSVLAVLLGIILITDFTGVNLFQSLWSNFERMEGLFTLLHLGAYFLVAGSLLTTEKLWKRFWHVSLFVSAYLGFYGLLQLAGVKEINQGGARLDATLGNATYFAIYMVFHAFIAAFYSLRQSSGKLLKGLYGLLIALQLYTLYHTATRGALLGFLGGALLATVLIAIFGREHRVLRRASLGVLAGLLILIGAFFALRNSDFVRQSEVLGRFASLSLSEGRVRFYVWNMGLQGFKERPLLGWGQGNFDVVFNKYYDPRMYTQEPWFDRAHDIVFDWLITAGVFGLLGYFALFAATLTLLWRDRAGVFSVVDKSLLTGLLAAYLFHNIFVFDNITSYLLFFSVLAFIHSRESSNARPLFAERDQARLAPRGGSAGVLPADRIAIPLVLIGLVVVLYALNIKGINASRLLIQAISPQEKGVTENLALFRRAIAASPIGRMEAREQLVQFALEAAGAEKIPPELKEEIARTAEQEMLAMLETIPRSARHRFFLGVFYRRLGRHEDAVKMLTEALELSEHKQQLRFELGLTHLDASEFDKALAVL
ncbi:MAG: O-antigen ligase family protein, partial [Patescibacteria group bacterium]|nr:O-antigen ligase family protein [Patescibacteria group bacterium]